MMNVIVAMEDAREDRDIGISGRLGEGAHAGVTPQLA
jgi:hypothetical protein